MGVKVKEELPCFCKDMVDEEAENLVSGLIEETVERYNKDKVKTLMDELAKSIGIDNVVKIGEEDGINRSRNFQQYECPRCTTIVDKDANFCHFCGCAFEWQDASTDTEYDYE